MKRATAASLAAAEGLLADIRSLGAEQVKPGVFYHKGRALLHFHEEDGALYCDLKEKSEWVRYPVGTPSVNARLSRAVRAALMG